MLADGNAIGTARAGPANRSVALRSSPLRAEAVVHEPLVSSPVSASATVGVSLTPTCPSSRRVALIIGSSWPKSGELSTAGVTLIKMAIAFATLLWSAARTAVPD